MYLQQKPLAKVPISTIHYLQWGVLEFPLVSLLGMKSFRGKEDLVYSFQYSQELQQTLLSLSTHQNFFGALSHIEQKLVYLS